MKNLDKLMQRKNQILASLATAIKSGEEAPIQAAMTDLGNYYTEMMNAYMEEATMNLDHTVLSGRGVRQLTTEEKQYYQAFIEAAKRSDYKQAITNIEKAYPQTVIDAVLEDMEQEHPLLAAVDFRNTSLITNIFLNAQGAQSATWGALGSMATNDLDGAIKVLNVTHCKLTARMCIGNDMLEAGPEWVDRYVRAILTDALAVALETEIVSGKGKVGPIGMDRDISAAAAVVSEEYPQKTPVAITDLSMKTIGKLKAKISKKEADGKTRPVTDLIMVANPTDLYEKIEPAIYVLTPSGYMSILRDNINIIPSVAVTAGKAIVGMGKEYLMCVGMDKGGKLEADDSVKFLEDARAYRIRLRGNGRAKDDHDFVLVSFTNLTEAALLIKDLSAQA